MLLLWVVPAVALAAAAAVHLSQRHWVSTDNAYVKSRKVVVSAQVEANVVAVAVRENEHVVTGQLLATLDDSALRIAVERAEAALATRMADVRTIVAESAEKRTELDAARRDLVFAERELARYRELANRRLVADARVEDAARAAEQARGRVAVLERDVSRVSSRLAGAETGSEDRHPEVRAATAALADARLALERSRIVAPQSGVVSRLPSVGDHLKAGSPALALVSDEAPWIEANFKETDLAAMRVGQRVEIELDAYSGVTWKGRVESIAQATGAEFAILPPQNATGNWVKVVQRLPVRIEVDPDPGAPVMRAGMSAYVRVDTRSGASPDGPAQARR
jgi:membrane fusion protein (multidrug efflux system)